MTSTAGQMIRTARKDRAVTLRDLGAAVGIDFTYCSKIENGAMPPPSDETIIKIADHLEIDRDELFVAFGKVPSDIIAALRGNRELTRRVRAMLLETQPGPP